MLEYISISKPRWSWIAALYLCLNSLFSISAWALDPYEFDTLPRGKDESSDHDFLGNAYTEFGEYQDKEEDAETLRFYQYGRFFGLSAGSGIHSVTGDRGSLWQGGFPSLTIRLHAWLTFNFSISIDFASYAHFFRVASDITRVNGTHFGIYLRYLVETRDLAAPLTFAKPYFFIGGGLFNKTEVSAVQAEDNDQKFGLGFGTGLEFTINPKKIYLDVEFKGDAVNFDDRFQPPAASGLPSLSGLFYTLGAHLKFTF